LGGGGWATGWGGGDVGGARWGVGAIWVFLLLGGGGGCVWGPRFGGGLGVGRGVDGGGGLRLGGRGVVARWARAGVGAGGG